ncbi:hypothetical protein GGF37_000278 [Kickxella alabastrina]|nr:hypothetical protein GGF37_000278 [Kickxella alabastrina]
MLAQRASKMSTTGWVLRRGPIRVTTSSLLPQMCHSRRWKIVRPDPIRPLPKFDLEVLLTQQPTDAAAGAAAARVHNPLLSIELGEKERVRLLKKRNAEELEKYIPAVRGSHPLPLCEDYARCWSNFLKGNHGILETPTRRYLNIYRANGPINRRTSFGLVKVFKTFREDDYKKDPKEMKFRTEFNFRKMPYSTEEFLALLTLYVRTLYTLPEDKRSDIASDFYFIVKAIRQRPKIHQKLIEMNKFRQLVMSYFLIVGQPFLALYVAVDLVTKSIPGTIDRWAILRLLNIQGLYHGDKEALIHLKNMDPGYKGDHATYDREYRLNILSHSILEYYYANPGITITDLELVRLIRCSESRQLVRELMDMLPMVLARFLRGSVRELPAADQTDLFYEKRVHNIHINDMQLVARYALALLQTNNKDMAVKFMVTIASMPSKPLENSSCNTGQLACSFIELAQAVPDNSPILAEVLEQHSSSNIDRSLNWRSPPEYRAYISEEIVRHMIGGEPGVASALTALLGSNSDRLNMTAAMGIIQPLIRHEKSLALEWIGYGYYHLQPPTQSKVDNLLISWMRDSREQFMDQLSAAAERAPRVMVRIASIMSQKMWDFEADRRYLLAGTFIAIQGTKNAYAAGSLLVAAAMGPQAHIKTSGYSGQQPLTQRAYTTAQLIKRLECEGLDMGILLSYMMGAVAVLKSPTAERMIWRELLRHGAEPNLPMKKASLYFCLCERVHIDSAAELVLDVLSTIRVVKDVDYSSDSGDNLPANRDAAISELIGGVSSISEIFDGDSLQVGTSKSRMAPVYVRILDGLNRAGLYDAVDAMAIYLLDSHERIYMFGGIASVWIDSVGYNPNSTSDDIQRAWSTLRRVSDDMVKRWKEKRGTRFMLNINNYNSVIEACVRKGDLDTAWYIIHVEMREKKLVPTLFTLYTLISPLAANAKLWPVGKLMVAKFNAHYPDIVQAALGNHSLAQPIRALLYAGSCM